MREGRLGGRRETGASGSVRGPGRSLAITGKGLSLRSLLGDALPMVQCVKGVRGSHVIRGMDGGQEAARARCSIFF